MTSSASLKAGVRRSSQPRRTRRGRSTPTGGVDAAPLPVLCKYAGTATYDRSGNVALSGPTTVVGFDVRTGRHTWEWKTDADPKLVDPTKSHVQLDDESVVLPDARGALFKLNLRSG